MRILLINQFVPPDEAPTSRLLGELGDALQGLGWEVDYLGGASRYRGKPLRGWRRWLRDARTHLRVLWRGLWVARPDVILCLTDPPALVFTAALVAGSRGSRLAHWAMDVYPEIAGALGELRRESLIYRMVKKAAMFGYERCNIIGCLDEDMADVLGVANDPRRHDCAPWPPVDLAVPEEFIPSQSSRIKVVYSGNLGRAHDFETLLRAQRILEDEDSGIDLVFQGGGPNRQRALEMADALGLKHCYWLDYASDESFVSSLMDAHVLAATQCPETRGLLWPSKLALMQLLPKPILWVGPVDGSIARMLKGHTTLAGVFTPGQEQEIARWLMDHRGDFVSPMAFAFSRDRLWERLNSQRSHSIDCWNRRLS